MELEAEKNKVAVVFLIFTVFISGIGAWTGEIHGRVICDVCGDSALGPEDHVLQGRLIPEELTNLIALQTLNLSKNLLTGRIPSQIGNMGRLESVDLSMNRLHGEMPASMTRMTILSRLNLSYNNLMGRIPESTQLQTLDPSGFVGNELCGPPLSKNCSESKVNPPMAMVEQRRGYDLFV